MVFLKGWWLVEGSGYAEDRHLCLFSLLYSVVGGRRERLGLGEGESFVHWKEACAHGVGYPKLCGAWWVWKFFSGWLYITNCILPIQLANVQSPLLLYEQNPILLGEALGLAKHDCCLRLPHRWWWSCNTAQADEMWEDIGWEFGGKLLLSSYRFCPFFLSSYFFLPVVWMWGHGMQRLRLYGNCKATSMDGSPHPWDLPPGKLPAQDCIPGLLLCEKKNPVFKKHWLSFSVTFGPA